MKEYDAVRADVARLMGPVRTRRGKPAATGQVVLKLVDMADPPLRVFFGDRPLDMIKVEYASRIATWEAHADLSHEAHGS